MTSRQTRTVRTSRGSPAPIASRSSGSRTGGGALGAAAGGSKRSWPFSVITDRLLLFEGRHPFCPRGDHLAAEAGVEASRGSVDHVGADRRLTLLADHAG